MSAIIKLELMRADIKALEKALTELKTFKSSGQSLILELNFYVHLKEAILK